MYKSATNMYKYATKHVQICNKTCTNLQQTCTNLQQIVLQPWYQGVSITTMRIPPLPAALPNDERSSISHYSVVFCWPESRIVVYWSGLDDHWFLSKAQKTRNRLSFLTSWWYSDEFQMVWYIFNDLLSRVGQMLVFHTKNMYLVYQCVQHVEDSFWPVNCVWEIKRRSGPSLRTIQFRVPLG